MSAQRPTYLLSPNWEYTPDGNLALGALITNPRTAPLKFLNRRKRLVPISPADIITTTKTGWSVSFAELKSGYIGVWTSFLAPLLGIGGDVAIHRSCEKDDVYTCRELETCYFDPEKEYIELSLRDSIVKEYLEKNWGKTVYMVTGVKIAKGARVHTSNATGWGTDVNIGFDGTPSGVPVGVGSSGGGERRTKRVLKFGGSDDFVLAYQLIKIRAKRDGSVDQKNFNKGALLSDELEELSDDWEVGRVSESIDADLSGQFLIPKGENGELEDYNIISLV